MSVACVIIPHYNDTRRLRRCLEAVSRSQSDVLSEVEVLVSDNATEEDLSWVVSDFPFVRLVVETQRGAASARNRGVKETTAERLVFLDSDCVPEPDWLERAASRPLPKQGGVVGGSIFTFDETPSPRSGPEAFETVFAFDQQRYIELKGFSVTANLVTSRDLFNKVGDFVHGVSEDVEWCRRAVRLGADLIYDPTLSVGHPTRHDWPSLRRKWVRMTREAFETRDVSTIAWLAKAALMPFSAFVHAPKVLTSSKLSGIRERLAGVATLFRLRLMRAWWMLRLAFGWRAV